MDIPNIPPQQTSVVLRAKAAQPSSTELYGTVGVCNLSPKVDETNLAERSMDESIISPLSPEQMAWNIFPLKYPEYSRGDISTLELLRSEKGPDFQTIDTTKATFKILQQPKHGTLTEDQPKEIFYHPNAGYVGEDKAVFLVNMQGYNIKVIYYFKVADVDLEKGNIQNIWNKYCPKDNWLISNSANPIVSLNTITASLTDGIYSTAFVGVDYTSISVTFANFTGATATITLTNAADYGWFINYTPYLNEEFLPPSNLNEWVAKADNSGVGYKY